ncbi:hypothetical protein [Vibrio splendidus]|nr:hypothetical protein [Vibrio splendidus]
MTVEVSKLESEIRNIIKRIKQGNDSTRPEWERAVDEITNGAFRLRGSYTKNEFFKYDLSPKKFNIFIDNHFSMKGCSSTDITKCIVNFNLFTYRPPMIITSITFAEHEGHNQLYGGHVIGILNAKPQKVTDRQPEVLLVNTSVKGLGNGSCSINKPSRPSWDGTVEWVKNYELKSSVTTSSYHFVNWVERTH